MIESNKIDEWDAQLRDEKIKKQINQAKKQE